METELDNTAWQLDISSVAESSSNFFSPFKVKLCFGDFAVRVLNLRTFALRMCIV